MWHFLMKNELKLKNQTSVKRKLQNIIWTWELLFKRQIEIYGWKYFRSEFRIILL